MVVFICAIVRDRERSEQQRMGCCEKFSLFLARSVRAENAQALLHSLLQKVI